MILSGSPMPAEQFGFTSAATVDENEWGLESWGQEETSEVGRNSPLRAYCAAPHVGLPSGEFAPSPGAIREVLLRPTSLRAGTTSADNANRTGRCPMAAVAVQLESTVVGGSAIRQSWAMNRNTWLRQTALAICQTSLSTGACKSADSDLRCLLLASPITVRVATPFRPLSFQGA